MRLLTRMANVWNAVSIRVPGLIMIVVKYL